MYYYKARIYSPTLGRFLQTDPIGYDDQFNLYAYVGNDPVNGTDPTGKWCVLGKIVKLAVKGGDLAATVAGAVEDVKTITSSNATVGERIMAGVSLATEVVSPVSIRDAKAIARAARGTCCFVAGTLVDTEAGLRPIESIKVGERIWSRDDKTGETALKEVTNLIQRHERVIWEVSLTGSSGESEAFETTDDHPWWIAGQGWKRTEELKAGMAVVTRDGRGMLLVSVSETTRTASTYNLTVADFETYFVGNQRVLVHNCPTEGVHKFKEGNGTYVGQSGNVEKRLGQHQRAGRLDSADSAEITPVTGGKTAREVAEHRAIQQETGGVPASQSPSVTNQRDPIGPNRRDLLEDD